MITSYRAWSVQWQGRLRSQIDATLQTGLHQRPVLHVSWNGATEVEQCWVRAESGHGPAMEAGVADRDEFETAIPLDREAVRYAGVGELTVQALDSDGHVLGTASVDRPARAGSPLVLDADVRGGGGQD